jgi:methylphosphotriester-DNA--protein-cysteine methyltransferase
MLGIMKPAAASPSVTTLPDTRTMYRALARRDPAYEGVFFTGVKTTGIFCRPTCRAKKPKPENVEFFPGCAGRWTR